MRPKNLRKGYDNHIMLFYQQWRSQNAKLATNSQLKNNQSSRKIMVFFIVLSSVIVKIIILYKKEWPFFLVRESQSSSHMSARSVTATTATTQTVDDPVSRISTTEYYFLVAKIKYIYNNSNDDVRAAVIHFHSFFTNSIHLFISPYRRRRRRFAGNAINHFVVEHRKY